MVRALRAGERRRGGRDLREVLRDVQGGRGAPDPPEHLANQGEHRREEDNALVRRDAHERDQAHRRRPLAE